MRATTGSVTGSVIVGVGDGSGRFAGRLLFGADLGTLRFLLVQVAQDLLDAILVHDRLVEVELDLRHAAQPQPAADLPPEERCGPLERLFGLAPRLRIAERRVVDTGQLEVGRDLDARQGDEADAGVVDVAAGEHLAQFLANLIGDAIGTEAHRQFWCKRCDWGKWCESCERCKRCKGCDWCKRCDWCESRKRCGSRRFPLRAPGMRGCEWAGALSVSRGRLPPRAPCPSRTPRTPMP